MPFTTLLVFLLMLYGAPQHVRAFLERMSETLAGVAVAYFFGLLVPQFQRMRRRKLA